MIHSLVDKVARTQSARPPDLTDPLGRQGPAAGLSSVVSASRGVKGQGWPFQRPETRRKGRCRYPGDEARQKASCRVHPADRVVYAVMHWLQVLIRAETGGKVSRVTQSQSETERMRASATPWIGSVFPGFFVCAEAWGKVLI